MEENSTRRASPKTARAERLPRVFIGSSSEGADWASELQAELRKVCSPIVWSQGVFGRNGLSTALQDLTAFLATCDFGVLVGTPDDLTYSRSNESASVRDNVLIEIGLLVGILGPERVMLLLPEDVDVAIPSDLAGVIPLDFRFNVSEDEMRASIGPAATTIRHAIRSLGRRPDVSASPLLTARAATFAIDLLGDVMQDIGQGTSATTLNARWTEHLLERIHGLFVDRADDLVVSWLRPNANNKLAPYEWYGKPYEDHYEYAAGEGLAGRVWSSGVADMHSPSAPSPRWLARTGCENAVYLCAPVGGSLGDLGVVGVGSDKGFPISSDDLLRMQLLVQVLGVAVRVRDNRGASRDDR
ncbi:TIR domain-containing protein [Micromonospora sp. NPDC005979]|uniref:TIR domain-containing protein n=1 Tax=Micromonospora sp. NPDC005979 TaxID=3156726 RepID=UPI0033AC99DF